MHTRSCILAAASDAASTPVSHPQTTVTRSTSPLRYFALGTLASALAFLPLNLSAATKYVAKTGSDSNDGNSIATAYLTIAKGIQNIGSGGRLYIGGGTYTEAITRTIPSGTADNARTVISNYQSEVVTIRPASGAARVVEFIDTDKYITVAANAPYQIILDAVNCGNNVVKFSSNTKTNHAYWPSYIRLQNLEIKSSPQSGILGYPLNCDFLNLKIHNAGSSVFDHGIYFQGNNNTIDGCDIYSNYARGIQIYMDAHAGDSYYASNNTVRNCRVHDNGKGDSTALKPGIDADAGDANKVYNNLVYSNGSYGIYVFYGATNALLYNNTVYANGSYGIRIDSTAGTGTVVRNNISYSNSGGNWSDLTGTATASNNLWNGTNPQFASTDPANSEFLKLTSASTAAIDQGTSSVSSLVTTDFWGDSRPQGAAYDIGADEYLSVGVPPAPTGLTATKAPSPDNYRQINLSWADVANETGYKIERKTHSDGTYSQIATVGANVVTYNDSTCGCGVTYYYRVRATNANGDSAYSAEAGAITDEVAARTGHWKLNEGTGTTTSDSSGNNSTGTLVNGPTWITGQVSNALNFDGVDDVVQVGSPAVLDNMAGVSVCGWINAASMGEGGLGRIVQKSAWSPQAGWFFFLSGTNQLGLSVDFSTTKLARTSGANAFATGTWQHVVVTWDGSTTATNAKIYVNGVEVGSYATTTNASGTRVDDSGSNFYIGNDSTGARTFNGGIDDVRVYSRALTPNEVLAIYRAGL